jgi:hypothetical protein
MMDESNEAIMNLTAPEFQSLVIGFIAGVEMLGLGPDDGWMAPADAVAWLNDYLAAIKWDDAVVIRLDLHIAAVLEWCWGCGIARAGVVDNLALRYKLAKKQPVEPNTWRMAEVVGRWPGFRHW